MPAQSQAGASSRRLSLGCRVSRYRPPPREREPHFKGWNSVFRTDGHGSYAAARQEPDLLNRQPHRLVAEVDAALEGKALGS